MYALTDIAGEHFWIGEDFIRIEDGEEFDGAIPCYATRAAADLEVRRQRKKQCALRAVWVAPRFREKVEREMFQEDRDKLAAMLCAMVRRAGGRVRLPLEELETIILGYGLRIGTCPREMPRKAEG